jgi:hypothetical protein
MPRLIVIDEIHLTILVPRCLPDAESDAVRQTLTEAAFEARLLRVIRHVFRKVAALSQVKVRLSR